MFHKSTEALLLELLGKMLVTGMLREVAQQEKPDKKHQLWIAATQPKATPLQCTHVWGGSRSVLLS